MEIWIFDCLKLERKVFSDFLADLGHTVKAFENRGNKQIYGVAAQPDVLIMGITTINDRGLRQLEQIGRLEHVADLFPGVPIIVVAPLGFTVPMECCASGVIHSFIRRPVPLVELEMELRHLDT